jgi:8-oxo-dGTP pyrophosphatase MutT (NUDIX family)
MSASAGNARVSRLAVAGSPVHSNRLPANFVRLSKLRKLSECEQVAAVCYRVCGDGIEFLLVRTRGSGRWTFPKGSTEPGLTHAQAAALEAFEEAGVHGRIEEASFARYRHPGRNTVNAHLCRVIRLSPPKESRRNRTWFSAEDAKNRLREGREKPEGAEFSRVVDRAVARIQKMQNRTGTFDDGLVEDQSQPERSQPNRPTWNAPQKDGLQKVKFDFAEAYGRPDKLPFAPYDRRLGDRLRSPVQTEIAGRRILQCEVLEFEPAKEINRSPSWSSVGKKPKALGIGARNG